MLQLLFFRKTWKIEVKYILLHRIKDDNNAKTIFSTVVGIDNYIFTTK